RWTTPDAGTPAFKAIQMYRNYDGAKSTFGETSVAAGVANADSLSAFAGLRAHDGALTVMIVNKVTSAAPVAVALNNFSQRGVASVWQLTSANQIIHPADLTF